MGLAAVAQRWVRQGKTAENSRKLQNSAVQQVNEGVVAVADLCCVRLWTVWCCWRWRGASSGGVGG